MKVFSSSKISSWNPVKDYRGKGNLIIQNNLYCGVAALMNMFSEYEFSHEEELQEVLPPHNTINLYYYCVQKIYQEYLFAQQKKMSLNDFYKYKKKYIDSKLSDFYQKGIGDYDFSIIYNACKKYCKMNKLKMEEIQLEDAKQNEKRNTYFHDTIRLYKKNKLFLGVIMLVDNHFICLKKIDNRLYKFDSLSTEVEVANYVKKPDIYWCIFY